MDGIEIGKTFAPLTIMDLAPRKKKKRKAIEPIGAARKGEGAKPIESRYKPRQNPFELL